MHATPQMQQQDVCSAADWLSVIERQQQEIQELRRLLANRAEDASGSAFSSPSSSKPWTPLSSPGSELLTPRYEDGLVDGDRYSAVCEKMQRVRSKLVKRDVQVRRARAQILALQDEGKWHEQTNSQLQTRMSELSLSLQRETSLKAQAIEKAAQAMMQCDALKTSLASLQTAENLLRSEARSSEARALATESSVGRLEHEHAQLQQRIAHLSSANEELQLRKSAAAEQAQASQRDQLLQHNLALQERVSSLEHTVRVQTEQVHTQQQSLVDVDAERALRSLEIESERGEHERHAVHLLQANIALQQRYEATARSEQLMRHRLTEAQEASAMVAEELELMRLKDQHRLVQLRKYDDDYKLLLSSYRELVRASSSMELSRRDVATQLAHSKKKVAVLQSALETLDCEIQKLSKAVAANRSRDQLVSQALREYGKRNRVLEDAVVATKKQLRCVLDTLRSSERRKSQAVSEATHLKRHLVLEKCQRSDLLKQCDELEKCLACCRSLTGKTQQRAQLLQTENGVLQDAVAQLCAYSHELVSSQQTLQRELKQLEVCGRVEPCVFG